MIEGSVARGLVALISWPIFNKEVGLAYRLSSGPTL